MRRLTPGGVDEMRTVARGIKRLDLGLDVILTSPLARARETAQIVAEVLECPEHLCEEPLLASGCDFEDLVSTMERHPRAMSALLVGHQPDLSNHVEVLTGGAVRMKKAALACVDCAALSPRCGELRWLLNPEHLARIGRS
jgi:phosphohistidine phosphatase